VRNVKQWMGAASAPVVALALTAVNALAQDDGTGVTSSSHSTTTTTTGPMWYGEWWVWAVGVAVFLIIVIALTNRGGRTSA